MIGLVLKVDGNAHTFVFDTPDIADKVHEMVGGYFEVIAQNFNSRVTMYADEDGKRHGKPINFLATILSGLWPQDYVVGDVVLVGAPDEQGDDQGLSATVIAAVLSIDVEQSWIKLTTQGGNPT
jgi:Domain of unknown function (DUF3846)